MTAASPWVILVTDALSEDGLAILRAEPQFDVRVKTGLSPQDLKREVAQAHVLLVRSGTKVTEDVLAAAPQLRAVGRAGTGFDNIDAEAATRRGVVVMNTPGGNSIAACEHTFALLLALLRNVGPASAELAQGQWTRQKYMGRQLHGKVMGLLGFGRIGREVARRARAFGMDVLTADPFVTEAVAREWEAKLVDKETLLATADVVSLHLPLTEESRHVLDAKSLTLMKRGAVLINCARGGLVDEPALLAAIDSGALSGAALDVFEKEPPEKSALLSHPKVVCTPHLGASTEEAQQSVAVEIAHQVRDFLLQGEIRNAVNVPSLSAEVYARVKPYLDLAERLGSLAGQIAGAPQRMDVIFRGECVDLPRSPVVSAAVVGLLRGTGGGGAVNYVNARLLASEMGIAIEEKAQEGAGDHSGLVEIAVLGSLRSSSVAGVVTASGKPRLARWEGLGLDAPPEGDILVLRNPDVPGVVGSIGTLLGDAGLNIAHIAWGRDAVSREAFTLINLDTPIPPDVLERIGRHEKVLWATHVQLP